MSKCAEMLQGPDLHHGPIELQHANLRIETDGTKTIILTVKCHSCGIVYETNPENWAEEH